MSTFDTHPKKLREDLLNSIYIKETALPDFQRDFVWQPSQTHSLIVSLAKRYPAGSILRLKVGQDEVFRPRAFEGAPPLNGHSPTFLVLDGQQRLTSLFQALYGTGDHVYSIDLRSLIEYGDLEEALKFDRKKEWDAYYSSLDGQARWGRFPLQEVFGGDGFYAWRDRLLDRIEEMLEEGKKAALSADKDTRRQLEQLYKTWIQPVETYEFPVVDLTAQTSLDAVCTIFETLNSTGVRLSVFDLLSARFYSKSENLRRRWDEAKDQYDLLSLYGIDPYYLLQAICASSAGSVKRSDVLKLTPDTVSKHWDAAASSMSAALQMLREECGVLGPNLMPYNTMLVPLTAIFFDNNMLVGAEKGKFRSRARRWFWCSVFSQSYESNPTSQTVTDVNDFHDWMNGGVEPRVVREFQFDRDRLLSVTTRQRAVYRGVLCLLLKNHPLDFHTQVPISTEMLTSRAVDDHHVFPDAYLKSTYPEFDQVSIDAIVNRTLIDSETNKRISKNPPATYLKQIADTWQSETGIDAVLRSHRLPDADNSSLRHNDFAAFRLERRDSLYNLIQVETSEY